MPNESIKISELPTASPLTGNEVIEVVQGGVNKQVSVNLLTQSEPGPEGAAGKSAYQLAVEKGYAGSVDQWLDSLRGPAGINAYQLAAQQGYTGGLTAWLASLRGEPGVAGLSAYMSALNSGFVGTEAQWIASLKGTNGTNGVDGKDGKDGVNGTNGLNGTNGTNGTDGKSAYQLAVELGYTGTLSAWLASLKGADGADGVDGVDGTNGTNGIDGVNGTNGADGVDGADGKSAYQLALDNGFVGTEAAWLASLVGPPGNDGVDGVDGINGVDGTDGAIAQIDDRSLIQAIQTQADIIPVGAYRKLEPWTPRLFSVDRTVSLRGSDNSLCDANGKFRFEGFQADGTNFNPAFFESAVSSANNPKGTTHTPIVVNGTGGGGVTGLIERVADSASTSAQTDPAKKFAWLFRVSPNHVVTANHARAQITTPALTPYKRYVNKFSARWDTTKTSANYSPLDTRVPPHDSMHEVLVWQLHQFNSTQPWETNQLGAGRPGFFLHYVAGRWRFIINHPREGGGGTYLNGAGNEYLGFDTGDNYRGFMPLDLYAPLSEYIDFTFEFLLDERTPSEGGCGYLKVYAGARLLVDYVGATLHPLRGEDKNPRIVSPAIRFGMYFYATPYETVTNRSVAESIIEAPQPLNPFKECGLLVREFEIKKA